MSDLDIEEAKFDLYRSLMSLGDERGNRASSERERGVAAKRDGDVRHGDMAIEHAWALQNQAVGIWEAARAVRDSVSPVVGNDSGSTS